MKIKNKAIIASLGAMICLTLTGCSENSQMKIPNNANATANDFGTFEWVSPDGVHYWVYNGTNRYGMAPRYDHNGKLVIEYIGE